MDFDHANPEPKELLDIRQNIRDVARMQTATGKQPLGILPGVVGELAAPLT
jgi:hypothetical protein